MAINSLEQMDLAGKKALIRADYNVPLADGVIQDDTRIRANVPTVRHVLDHGGAAVVCSHLGAPKGGHEMHHGSAGGAHPAHHPEQKSKP